MGEQPLDATSHSLSLSLSLPLPSAQSCRSVNLNGVLSIKTLLQKQHYLREKVVSAIKMTDEEAKANFNKEELDLISKSDKMIGQWLDERMDASDKADDKNKGVHQQFCMGFYWIIDGQHR
jgi:hypothetical protein